MAQTHIMLLRLGLWDMEGDNFEKEVGERLIGRMTVAAFILAWVLFFSLILFFSFRLTLICTLNLFLSFQTCLTPSASFLWFPTRRYLRLVAGFQSSVAHFKPILFSWAFTQQGLGSFGCFMGKLF